MGSLIYHFHYECSQPDVALAAPEAAGLYRSSRLSPRFVYGGSVRDNDGIPGGWTIVAQKISSWNGNMADHDSYRASPEHGMNDNLKATMEFTRCIDVVSVLRDQFVTFDALGRAIRLNPDRQRRVLLLAPDDWPRWSYFKDGGPLPAQPMPPIMLRRLATATYRLACRLERRPPTGP